MSTIKSEVEALNRDLIPLERVVIDESLYPRYREDRQVIASYAEAMRAGADFPPVKLDQNNRLIDGLHRFRAAELNQQSKIRFERERVKDDVDFFRRAMVANSHHGRRYTQIDYAHMVIRGREMGMKDDDIARMLFVTPGYLEEATRDWFAMNTRGTQQVPIKHSIKHMRGRRLNEGQLEANRKLSGWNQSFHVSQLLLLLNNDLIDTENEKLVASLAVLQEALGQFFMGLQKKARR